MPDPLPTPPLDAKPSFATQTKSVLRQVGAGAAHVIATAWTVPAARSTIATLLIRWGLPSTLVGVGMAIGEALAK